MPNRREDDKYFKRPNNPDQRKLDQSLFNDGQIKRALFVLLIRSANMSKEMDDLRAQVSETRGAMKSAVELIRGLRQQIIDAGTDPTALAEITTGLKEDEDALSEAVANNPGGSTGNQPT